MVRIMKPIWQDRILVLLTHKKALVNEIHMESNIALEA